MNAPEKHAVGFVPDSHPVRLCRGRGVRDNEPFNVNTTVGAVEARLQGEPLRLMLRMAELATPEGKEAKRNLGYIIGGPSDRVSRKGNGWRESENFPERDIVTLDVDTATPQFVAELGAGAGILGGMRYAWHTTVSSTREKPKLRIFLWPERPLTAEDHRLCVDGLKQSIEAEHQGVWIDPTCGDTAHIMFTPAVCCDGDYDAGQIPGTFLDVARFVGIARAAGEEAEGQAEEQQADARNQREQARTGGYRDDGPEIQSRWEEVLTGLGVVTESPWNPKAARASECPRCGRDGVARVDWTADGRYVCRVCGQGGNVITFVKTLEGIDGNAAFARCRKILGMPSRTHTGARGTAFPQQADEEWGEPEPLPETPRGPSLLDDSGDGRTWLEASLPRPLADFVALAAEASEVSHESLLAGLLPVAALALGPNVLAGGNGDHIETMSLWVLSSEPPGNRKSEAMRIATAPLADLEKEMAEAHRIRHAEWRKRNAARERELNSIKKRIDAHYDAVYGTAKDDKRMSDFALNEIQARTGELHKEEMEDPAPGELLLTSTSCTPEAVAAYTATSKRFGAISADGATILNGISEYKDGNGESSVAQWCQLFTGDPVRVARRGSAPLLIEQRSAMLSCGLAIQPSVLATARRNSVLTSQGFMARFIKLVAPLKGRIEEDHEAPAPLAPQYRAWWDQTVLRLGRSSPTVQTVTRCCPEAERMLRRFQNEMSNLSSLNDENGGDPNIGDWARKAHGTALRVACLFHHIEGRDHLTRISKATLETAITLVRYGLRMEMFIAGQDEAARSANMRTVVEKMVENQMREATLRELHRKHWRGLREVEDVRRAVESLVEADWLRKGPRTYTLRPDAEMRISRSEVPKVPRPLWRPAGESVGTSGTSALRESGSKDTPIVEPSGGFMAAEPTFSAEEDLGGEL